MRSFTAGRTTPTALYTITPEARSAAQSSADSQPGPPISAMQMPTKAAAEVMASERWCQASAETAVLPTDSPSRRDPAEPQFLDHDHAHQHHERERRRRVMGRENLAHRLDGDGDGRAKSSTRPPRPRAPRPCRSRRDRLVRRSAMRSRSPLQTISDENRSAVDSMPSAMRAWELPMTPAAILTTASTALTHRPISAVRIPRRTASVTARARPSRSSPPRLRPGR